MRQYEEENDLGSGGGEVDDELLEEAWRRGDELRANENPREDAEERPAGD